MAMRDPFWIYDRGGPRNYVFVELLKSEAGESRQSLCKLHDNL